MQFKIISVVTIRQTQRQIEHTNRHVEVTWSTWQTWQLELLIDCVTQRRLRVD